MATGAIGWKGQSRMVRIGGLVICGCMTTCTRVWCIAVITLMAVVTPHTRMRTCQRIHRAVVEGRGDPRRLRVAQRAVRRELRRCVVWIRRLVVLRCMAPCAGIGRIGVVALVTGRAIASYTHMCAL